MICNCFFGDSVGFMFGAGLLSNILLLVKFWVIDEIKSSRRLNFHKKQMALVTQTNGARTAVHN